MNIRLPPLEEIAERWSEIMPLLKRATDETSGCYEPIHIYEDCCLGHRAIWLIEKEGTLLGVAVAGAEQYPTGKRVWRIAHVAGDQCQDWWATLIAEMEAHGRKWNCSAMSAFSRPGWERFSRRAGIELKPLAVVLGREL